MSEPAPLDLDAILDEIRAAVDANTASGVYTDEIENELRSHYARVLDREDRRDRFDALRKALEQLERERGFSAERISTSSGVPGGEVLHKTAAKMVSRQVNGLVEQLNDFSDVLMPALNLLAGAVSEPRSHTHEDLVHEIDTLQDRVAVLERTVGRLAAMVDDLERLLPRAIERLDHHD